MKKISRAATIHQRIVVVWLQQYSLHNNVKAKKASTGMIRTCFVFVYFHSTYYEYALYVFTLSPFLPQVATSIRELVWRISGFAMPGTVSRNPESF